MKIDQEELYKITVLKGRAGYYVGILDKNEVPCRLSPYCRNRNMAYQLLLSGQYDNKVIRTTYCNGTRLYYSFSPMFSGQECVPYPVGDGDEIIHINEILNDKPNEFD